MIRAIDHVQLAMPADSESLARQFYGELLGLDELPKSPRLAASGEAWFDRGAVQLHLGVEADFRPALKAHPGLPVDGLHELPLSLQKQGVAACEGVELPDCRHVCVDNFLSHRIEPMPFLSFS